MPKHRPLMPETPTADQTATEHKALSQQRLAIQHQGPSIMATKGLPVHMARCSWQNLGTEIPSRNISLIEVFLQRGLRCRRHLCRVRICLGGCCDDLRPTRSLSPTSYSTIYKWRSECIYALFARHINSYMPPSGLPYLTA